MTEKANKNIGFLSWVLKEFNNQILELGAT